MTAGVIATAWTTPTTASQRPFILWCDWTDIWNYVDIFSVDISATGGNVPRQMKFTAMNLPTSVVLANQMRVLFMDSQANANAGRILFHGFIKDLKPRLSAIRADWDVTCADLSELLDYSTPIENNVRPAGETDAARVGAAMAYSTWGGIMGGGFVQTLNSVMPVAAWTHDTSRSALEDTLSKTGVTPVGYYVDDYGYLHTYQVSDAGAAPFQISDTPNYTTTIPARVEPEFVGTTDVDYAFVYGGTTAGTGVVSSANAPRFPARYATIDAPDVIDATGLANAGAVELGTRQNVTTCQVSVSGDAQHGNFDGWHVGQNLAITNSVMGWAAKVFYINGVDMTFVNGAGMRKYVLTCATSPRPRRSIYQMLPVQTTATRTTTIHTKSVAGAKSPAKGIG